MIKLKQALLGIACACALAGPAQATSVALPADGQWFAFDVDEFVSQSFGLEWIDAGDGSALTFDFTIPVGAVGTLTVVDGGFAGDQFEVFNGATSLGLTSVPTQSYPSSLGLDFDGALADPDYSSRVFFLPAGSYSINGLLFASAEDDFGAINATVGAVKLVVPEPGTWGLVAAGLLVLGALARRRHA